MTTHLPFDIQLQILKRLPVKSLIQFRSVCKAWKSLIDSSHFIAGYSFLNTQSQHLVTTHVVEYGEESEVKYVSFVDDDTFPQQKFTLTDPPLHLDNLIIGSSHGLLCVIGWFEETDDSSEQQMAVLWNPAIRKSIVVVVPSNNNNVVGQLFSYVVGFGVCPDTKDPKLVKITYTENNPKTGSISSIPCQVMVFTLSSGEWTCLCSSNLPRESIQFSYHQTNIGRFIYWLAKDRMDEDTLFWRHNLIMSFDMSTQEFREIELAAGLFDGLGLSISRLRESLVVVEYNNVSYGTDSRKGVCVVWIMDDGDSKAFTKLFTINLPNASVSRTLGFRKNGEPIVEMCDDYRDFETPCALVVYEPWSEHIKDLGIRVNRYSFFVNSYTESLLLLDHDDGHIVRCEEMTPGTG